MTKLSQLLHELVDHATAPGNRRGELHALVDEAAAEVAPAAVAPWPKAAILAQPASLTPSKPDGPTAP